MQSEIADILGGYGYSPHQICRLSFGQSKVNFMNEFISGGLSADIMDYLPHDGLFTGAEYAKLDYHRLVSSLEVSKNRLAINRSALNSLESMLISRYEMFKAVYFHKTVRAAEVMLLRSMISSDEALGLTNTSLRNYLALTDEATLEVGSVRSQADMHFRARLPKIIATGGCLSAFMKNSCISVIGKGWIEKHWRHLPLILQMWHMSIATMSLWTSPMRPIDATDSKQGRDVFRIDFR